MNLINRYSDLIKFSIGVVVICLLMPFIYTAMLAGFVTIVEPEKLPLSDYLLLLGESFIYHYYLNIPAIFLIFFSIIFWKKS